MVCPVASSVSATTFNGIPIHELDRQTLVTKVLAMRGCDHSHVVHFLAADPLTTARRQTRVRIILRQSDLNVADGLPVVWAVHAAGGRTRRITASDGLDAVCSAGVADGVRHFFFGSSEDVVTRLAANLRANHPGLEVVGVLAPPFRPLSTADVADAAAIIRGSGTDVLWIGLGAPKQNFVAEELRAQCAAPVIITIGAAFDFASGAKRRAPSWMQRVGLEWLFRLIQEPRRLGRRYVVGNTRFIIDLVRATWLAQIHQARHHRPT